jgi:hypothetical protein
MKDNLQAGHESSSDLQMDGIVQSLSQWAELDVLANVQASRSMLLGSSYSERLMKLQAARRFLNVRIEDELRIGMPTADLEQELEAKRMETRSFLAYLEHARVRP